MDDLTLSAKIGDEYTLYVAPIHRETYREFVSEDNLGGESGYFLLRSTARGLEVLAKAPTFEAASALFDLIVRPLRASPL
tara:strand:- start:734 stop:973 length:240 start_codon:yes stop_codon:yes gene_type:complete